ncbi:hypothetical protein B0H14DRAFT_3027071, partial [Mycena olivaceomarginata]
LSGLSIPFCIWPLLDLSGIVLSGCQEIYKPQWFLGTFFSCSVFLSSSSGFTKSGFTYFVAKGLGFALLTISVELCSGKIFFRSAYRTHSDTLFCSLPPHTGHFGYHSDLPFGIGMKWDRFDCRTTSLNIDLLLS